MVKIPDEWEITPEEKAAYAATNPLNSAALEESMKETKINALYNERSNKIVLLSLCRNRGFFVFVCWPAMGLPILYSQGRLDPIISFIQSFLAV